jgi:hypothetical protein
MHKHTWIWVLTAVLWAGCGDDDGGGDDGPCTPGTVEGCEGGLVCEDVMGGEPTCFAPVTIRGRILDLADESGVQDATVVAVDVNGAARSSVVRSEEDGEYAITLPVTRTADGTPVADPVTLRVAAAGYQPFPAPPREALPIDLESATADGGGADAGMTAERVVMNAATTVGLVALPGDRSGDASIRGEIVVELGDDDPTLADGGVREVVPAGALVVAVQGEEAVSTAIADLEGEFILFNVPAGPTRVEAYKVGMRVTPEDVSPEAGEEVTDVTLAANAEGLSTVSGSVNIVNAEGGLTTSVILVLESTYDADVIRGSTPPGLRAEDVSSAFSIDGVPPGDYAVLAAFENDRLVRDPDTSIAGTDVVFIEVTGSGDAVGLDESFKVTEALEVVSPGADGLEVIDGSGDVTFEWADDSSEDGYELRVYDSFGELAHEATDVPRVTGSATATYTWGGASLEAGVVYQFRVVSYREDRGASGGRTYISASEDLRGVFQAGMVEQ